MRQIQDRQQLSSHIAPCALPHEPFQDARCTARHSVVLADRLFTDTHLCAMSYATTLSSPPEALYAPQRRGAELGGRLGGSIIHSSNARRMTSLFVTLHQADIKQESVHKCLALTAFTFFRLHTDFRRPSRIRALNILNQDRCSRDPAALPVMCFICC